MTKIITVVGCGIAGDEAAFSVRKNDPEARIIIVDHEPQPLYSACVLADYVAGELPKKRICLKDLANYQRSGIELILSTKVTDCDPERNILHLEDRDLPYDQLILATGSQPFIPPLPGANKKGVFTLKTLADAENLRCAKGNSAVVVGSGPIGIESAIALQRRGFSVVLIELLDCVLPRLFDPPMARSLQVLLEREGINVRTGERVQEIHGDERVEFIRTDKNSFPCDVAVLVMGMKPEVTLAKKGGLIIGPSGGIQVNDAMLTSKAAVWACGDCVESQDRISGKRGSFMLWNNARLQGTVAGTNAAGGHRRYSGSLNVTNVNFFNHGAASVGSLARDLSENDARVIHKKGPRGDLWLVFREDKLVGIQAIDRRERFGRILGILLNGGAINKEFVKNCVKQIKPVHRSRLRGDIHHETSLC